MKSIFTQKAEHRIGNPTCLTRLDALPQLIRKHSDWSYTCVQTDAGCFLKPEFRDMPYRNAFVPEIDVAVSCNAAQVILYISGRPVGFVRVFMAVWFGFALMMEVFLLALGVASNLDSLFPVFIPIMMCVFGYLLCQIVTRAAFQSVIKAIQKELK